MWHTVVHKRRVASPVGPVWLCCGRRCGVPAFEVSSTVWSCYRGAGSHPCPHHPHRRLRANDHRAGGGTTTSPADDDGRAAAPVSVLLGANHIHRASTPFPGYALVEQPALDAIKSSSPGLLPHHSSRSSTTPAQDWLYLYIQILYKLRCGGAPRRITRRTPSEADPVPVTSASRSALRQRCTDRCDRSTAGVRHHHARRGCRPRGDSPLSAAPVDVAPVPAGNGGHDQTVQRADTGSDPRPTATSVTGAAGSLAAELGRRAARTRRCTESWCGIGRFVHCPTGRTRSGR